MKKTLLPAMLLSIAMLSGCFPSGEMSGVTPSAPVDSIGEGSDSSIGEISGTGSNVTFDIIYPENFTEQVQLYSGKLKEWNIRELAEYFIPDFESREDDITEYTERENSRGAYFSYRFNDGQSLITYPGYVNYDRYSGDPRDFGINFSYYNALGESEKEMNKYFSFKEAEGFSSRDALRYAQETADRLGLKNLSEPQIYTVESKITPFLDEIDAEYTEEELEELTGNPAYYILYTVRLDGYNTPLVETYFRANDKAGLYGSAEFLIGEEGLISFCAMGYMDYTPTGEYVEICAPEEAAAMMKNTIGMAGELNPTVIKGVELYYLGDYDETAGTSEFFPAWKFIKVTDDGSRFMYHDCYYYDARTCAIIQ